MHGEHVVHARDHRDRREVFQRVVAQLRIESRVHGERADVAEEQRVAVGRAARDELGADLARRAAAVVDDDLLRPHFAELLRDDAAHEVGGARRRERDDDADGARGEVASAACVGVVIKLAARKNKAASDFIWLLRV